jgi:hypothetical protein
VLSVLLGASWLVASTATSNVPPTKVEDVSGVITAAALAPAGCAGVPVSSLAVGDGDFTAGGLHQLVLGGPAPQSITGTPGDDCIVGGAGADTLDGGGGTDVCIGNAATTFVACATQFP